MNKSSFSYVAKAKRKLGGPFNLRASDSALGKELGCSASLIANAKAGNMSDPLAIKIAEFIGEDPGEVLSVARAERERDQVVREHLMRYVGKALRAVPSKAANAVAVIAVALCALAPDPAYALGGVGRPRQ